MNTEFLLDAMGLLDDALIREAEQYAPRRRPVPWQNWVAWAASLAVVITLGYGVVHIGFFGGMGGGSAEAPSGGADTPSGSTGGGSGWSVQDSDSQSQESLNQPPAGAAGPDAAGGGTGADTPLYTGFIWLEGTSQDLSGGVYQLTGQVAELPVETVSLGELSALYPDAPGLITDVEAYVGCQVWAEGDGPDRLYIQLPDGRYTAAELVQPQA